MSPEDTTDRTKPPRSSRVVWMRPVDPWGFDLTPAGVTLFYGGVPIMGPTCDWTRILEALRPVTPETLCLMRDLWSVWQIMAHLDRMRMRTGP